jgi:hypothetical protein
VRLKLAFFALYLSLAMMHGYATVARYDRQEAFENDSLNYGLMSKGQPLQETLRTYKWRALTPYMVRLMPWLPDVVTGHYQVDPDKILRFKWAAWNELGCAVGGLAVLVLCLTLGLRPLQAGIGGLLYMLSFPITVDGGMLLVDPWANALMALCLALALRGRVLAFALAFALGIFFKETIVLALLWVALLRRPRWPWFLAAALPGLAAYAWFRCVLYPGGPGLSQLDDPVANTLKFFEPHYLVYAAVELALVLGVLAPLAALGWKASAGHPALRRMAWLLPLILVLPMVTGAELQRPWWTSFPVIVPLATLGLWRLFDPTESSLEH